MEENEEQEDLTEEIKGPNGKFVDINKMPLEEMEKMMSEYLMDDVSIDEMISSKKMEDYCVKQSFKSCDLLYKNIIKSKRAMIITLKKAKRFYSLQKIKCIIGSLDDNGIINEVIEKINDTESKLNEKNELLTNIKNSLELLKKNNIALCNNHITLLLVLIQNLNTTRMKDCEEFIKGKTISSKWISYVANKEYEKEIDELEEKIDDHALKLGINKK